jgi:RNA polymerase sigma-70 factor, ECF subfamily
VDPRQDVVFQSARAGDPRAFHSLLDDLGPPLVRFVTFLLNGDRDAAHDVVQDVFVRAWQALRSLQNAEHLRNWCYRVARCKTASWARRQGSRWRRLRHVCAQGDPPALARPESMTAEAVSEQPVLHQTLRRAVGLLPRVYLAPIQLHYLQGLDTAETARLLGLTVTTTKMRLRRARLHLKRVLLRHPVPRTRGTSGQRGVPRQREDPGPNGLLPSTRPKEPG